jgi:hypothetical protein
VIRRWSRHSRRSVPMNRSAIAFARGARIGVRITRMSAAIDVGVDLDLQRLGQHPAGALADEFVDQHRRVGAVGVIGVGSSRNYGEHGSYLPDRRWRADLA